MQTEDLKEIIYWLLISKKEKEPVRRSASVSGCTFYYDSYEADGDWSKKDYAIKRINEILLKEKICR